MAPACRGGWINKAEKHLLQLLEQGHLQLPLQRADEPASNQITRHELNLLTIIEDRNYSHALPLPFHVVEVVTQNLQLHLPSEFLDLWNSCWLSEQESWLTKI